MRSCLAERRGSMTRRTLLRLALPLSACGVSVGFATTGACRTAPSEPPPPIAGGRYVLVPGGSLPVLPGTFADSAGRIQRMFGDTIDLALSTNTYTERGRVAMI